jgi:hypothetical protein
MRKFHLSQHAIFLFISLLLLSCEGDKVASSSQKKSQQNNVEEIKVDAKEKEREGFDMTNPAFMMGTNIGILFKTYYNVGDFNNMITYTASSTIKKYGREKLMSIYRKLNFGFDMKFKNMTNEGDEKILHYEILMNATKQVKRLHVIIENDTARIVPQHLENGDVFE